MGSEEGRKSDWRMLTEREKGSTHCGDLEPRQIFDFETEEIQSLGEDIKREEELKTGKGNKINLRVLGICIDSSTQDTDFFSKLG